MRTKLTGADGLCSKRIEVEKHVWVRRLVRWVPPNSTKEGRLEVSDGESQERHGLPRACNQKVDTRSCLDTDLCPRYPRRPTPEQLQDVARCWMLANSGQERSLVSGNAEAQSCVRQPSKRHGLDPIVPVSKLCLGFLRRARRPGQDVDSASKWVK
ncbi:hypothetical protein VUR80DRAFT_4397 [Thermomyces stellatus]